MEQAPECDLPGFDAISTPRAAISPLHGLLTLRNGGIRAWSECDYLLQRNHISISTLHYIQKHTPGSAIPQSPHLGAVPRFLR